MFGAHFNKDEDEQLSKADVFIELLIGKALSHVWRGYGSAIFLEFGVLTPRLGRDGEKVGEMGDITIGIEWSWRIERSRSIIAGSWSEEKTRVRVIPGLIGSTVTHMKLFGELPEISISLSSGHRVVSFMTAEGQPSWAVTMNRPSPRSLSVKRGFLCVENG